VTRAGAQQGAQLNFEEIRFIQAHANSAPSQERISFFTEVQIIKLFIAAHIKRSNYHRALFHHIQNCFVSAKLFFFGRGGGAFQVEEFCPEQPNAFRSEFKR